MSGLCQLMQTILQELGYLVPVKLKISLTQQQLIITLHKMYAVATIVPLPLGKYKE